MADVLSARKDWPAARDAYAEAIRDTATLYNKLGICEQRLGDDAAAHTAYARALDLRPDYAEAWNNLGTLDHAREDYEAAVFAYEKSIALDPTDPVVYRNLGQAWLSLDDVEKTLQAWSQAMRLDPTALTSGDKDSVLAGTIDLARKYYIYAKLVAANGDVDPLWSFSGSPGSTASVTSGRWSTTPTSRRWSRIRAGRAGLASNRPTVSAGWAGGRVPPPALFE